MSKQKSFIVVTEHLIKNPDVFKDTYIPKEILFREKELNELSTYTFSPCANYGVGSNVFINGETGTGKTLSVNYLIEETERIAKKEKINIRPIYINCSTLPKKGEFHVIRTLCERLLPKGEFKLGYEITKYLDFIQEYFKNTKANIILILDEIDKIKSESADRLLTILTRTDFSPSNITIICIYNNIYFRDNLLPSTLSSFKGSVIVFTNYDADQLFQILRMRAGEGLKPNTINEKTLVFLATIIDDKFKSDVRKGIEILERAARYAEINKKIQISKDDIESAAKKIIETEIRNYFAQMDHHKIYTMALLSKGVEENGKIKLVELYKKYKQIMPSTEEAYTEEAIRKKLDEICSTGLILKRARAWYLIPKNLDIIHKILEEEVRKRFKFSMDTLLVNL